MSLRFHVYRWRFCAWIMFQPWLHILWSFK